MAARATTTTSTFRRGVWSTDEHDRFLEAIELHPDGPWGAIAAIVGTRNTRQVQTHAQKYYDKIARRLRGLQRDRNALNGREHRIEASIIKLASAKSPELEAVRARVSQVSRRTRGIVVHTNGYSDPPACAVAPPCLQRLRVLPRRTPQESSKDKAESEPLDVDSPALPPLDLALDFFIANLDTHSTTALPPFQYLQGCEASHAVHGFSAHDAPN